MRKRKYITMLTSLIAFGFCFTLLACDNVESSSNSNSDSSFESSTPSIEENSSSSEVLTYYQVTFDPNNGEDTYSYEVLDNNKVLNSNVPTKDGYTFTGWYNGNDVFDIYSTNITQDITLKAKWIANNYTIYFDLDGGKTENSSLSVTYDSEYSLPLPIKKGYTFTGWTLNDQEFNNGIYTYTKDITITANYTVNNYELTYYSNLNDSDDKTTLNVTYNQVVSLPTLTQTGYVFTGWYYNDEKVQTPFIFNYEENVVLQAKWEAQKYTITLDLNGGESEHSEVIVSYNQEFVIPTPSKENYKFVGWYLYNSLFTDSVYTKTFNISLKAKWEELPRYSVSYYHDDELLYSDVVVSGNTYIIRDFEDIEGHKFLYWTSEENRYYPSDSFVYDFDYDLVLSCYLETPEELESAKDDAPVDLDNKIKQLKQALDIYYEPENPEVDVKPFKHLSIDERNAIIQMIDLVEMKDLSNCQTIEEVLEEKRRVMQVLDNIMLLARLEDDEDERLEKEIEFLENYRSKFSYIQINQITQQFKDIDTKYKFIDSFYTFTIKDEELLKHVLSLDEQELNKIAQSFDYDVDDLTYKYLIIYSTRLYTQAVVDDVNYRLSFISNAIANDYGYQFRLITDGKEFLEIPTDLSYQEVLKLSGTPNDEGLFDINTNDGHVGEINKIYKEALAYIDSIEGKYSRNEAISKINELQYLTKEMKDGYVSSITSLGDLQDIYNQMQEAKENGIAYQDVLKEFLDNVNNTLDEAIIHDEAMKLVLEYIETNNKLWEEDFSDLYTIRGYSDVQVITGSKLDDLVYGYATIVISNDGTIIYAYNTNGNAPTPNDAFYHDGTYTISNGQTSSIFKFHSNYDGTLKKEDGTVAYGKGEYLLVLPEGATLITGSQKAMSDIFNKICTFNNVDDVITANKGSLDKVAVNDLFDTFSNTTWTEFVNEGDKLIKETYDRLMNCKVLDDVKDVEKQFNEEYRLFLEKYDELYKELDKNVLVELQGVYLNVVEQRINEELTKLDNTELMFSFDLLRQEYREKINNANFSYDIYEIVFVDFEKDIEELLK